MSATTERLHLNRRDGMIVGVCAGLADYFGLSAFVVRLAFVIATLVWPPMLLVYGVLFLCLNDKSRSELGESLSRNRMVRHFRAVDYGKRLYKSRRNKKLAGVCGGLADYFEISSFWVRLAFVLALFVFLGPFAILAYVIAAVMMDKEPLDNSRSSRSQRECFHFFDERPVEKRDIRDTASKFADLEKKLRRLEATITSKKFKLHSEFNRM